MSDYSDADTDYNDFVDLWNPFDSPDDYYDEYMFYDGYDDSYDDIDYDQSESDARDLELADYMDHLAMGLRKLQDQNTFCDVTLRVGSRSFHAHKAILSACSDYFMAMFTSGFQEAGTAEVTLEGDSDTFESLLEFAYTGGIKDLSPETVPDVMSMAGYLQFTHALKMCKTYVTKKYGWDEKAISLQQAYEISLLAEGYGLELTELIKKSKAYLTDNFFYLAKKDNFAEDTSFECLETCLDYYNNTKSAADTLDNGLLDVITNWLRHKWTDRKHHAHTLLKKLRLGLIPTDALEKLRETKEVQELADCETLLDEVLQLKISKTPEWLTDTPLYISHPQLFAKRTTNQCLVAIGGTRGHNRSINLKSNYASWLSCERDIPRLPEKICYHSAITVNGHLFVAGGMICKGKSYPKRHARHGKPEVDGKIHAKAYWYDTGNKQWQPLPHMKRARKDPTLVHMDDNVYAIGGIGRSGPLKHMECYSLTSKTWYHAGFVAMEVKEPSVVVHKGKILMYGPRTNLGDTYVLQMYSTKKTHNGASSGSPGKGTWNLLRTDKLTGVSTGHFKPVLTVQDGKCYRVMYEALPVGEDSADTKVKYKARVNEVVCDFDSKVPSASIGAEEKQHEDLMKCVIGGVTFCIKDDLFFNACGVVYKVGLTTEDMARKKKSDENVWINVDRTDDIHGASVVLYTYEAQ